MRIALGILSVAFLALAGCQSDDADYLASRYPIGATCTSIVQRCGSPDETFPRQASDANAPMSREAKWAWSTVKRDYPDRQVDRIDRYFVFKSALFGVHIYHDYVAYDPADRVTASFRRFID